MEQFFTKKEIEEMIVSKKKEVFYKEVIESYIKLAVIKGLWFVKINTLDIPDNDWAIAELKRLRTFGYSVKFEGDFVDISWDTPLTMMGDDLDGKEGEYTAVEAHNETKRSIDFYMSFCKKLIKQRIDDNNISKEIFLGEIPEEVEKEIIRNGFTLKHGEGLDPILKFKNEKKTVKGVFIVMPGVE